MRNNNVPCTVALVVVNAAVFLWLAFHGVTEDAGYMLMHGAMYTPDVMENHNWITLLTSMFIHFDIAHIVNNMAVLFFVGQQLERTFGSPKFLAVYFLSGLGGNVLSVFMELRTQDYAVSGGASGAIFGLIGALLLIAIRNRGRAGVVSRRGLMVTILITLYYGFTSTGVNNAAHIGGLVTGFVLGLLLYRKKEVHTPPSDNLESEKFSLSSTKNLIHKYSKSC